MTERPKRKIKLPSLLNEYIVISENDTNSNSCSIRNKIVKLLKSANPRPSPSLLTPEHKRKINTRHGSKFECHNNDSVKFKDNSKEIQHIKPSCKAYGSKIIRKGLPLSKQLQQDEGKYLCQECGKSLSSSQSFAEHSNIHKNIKPYICEICGKCSRQWSVHSRHLLTHDKNANIFTCTICSKAFRSKVYLKFHIRKHLNSEVKPHICSNCSKSFTSKTELDRHVISHSSIHAYVCTHCQKKFKFKHNLKAHLRAHMGKQSWKCHVCSASFPQNSLLKAHQRDHKEMIQNVELAKVDSRTINVLTFPLDRRKVAKAQEVSLPKHLSLDSGDELNKSNLSLCLNDVSFPLSVVANSFGTGKYITVKIIDPKVKNSDLSTQEKGPIKAFISAAESDLQECLIDGNNKIPEQPNIPALSNTEVTKDSTTRSTLKIKNQMKLDKLYEDLRCAFNHCEEKLKICDYNEETVCTIKNLISIIDMLSLPLSYEACVSLNKIVFYLQTYLTEKNPQNNTNAYYCDKNFHSVSPISSSFANKINYNDNKNIHEEDHSIITNAESSIITDSTISITNCDKVIGSGSIQKVTLLPEVAIITDSTISITNCDKVIGSGSIQKVTILPEVAIITDSTISITNCDKVIGSGSIKKVTLLPEVALPTYEKPKRNKDHSTFTHIKEVKEQNSLWVCIHSLYQHLFRALQEHFRYKMENLMVNVNVHE